MCSRMGRAGKYDSCGEKLTEDKDVGIQKEERESGAIRLAQLFPISPPPLVVQVSTKTCFPSLYCI